MEKREDIQNKNPQSLGARLRRERESRDISIAEITASTRINAKFLEAIESGDFSVLPRTYVRAFIREYIDALGLDHQEYIRHLDAILGREKEKDQDAGAGHESDGQGRRNVKGSRLQRPRFFYLMSPQNLFIGLFILAAIVIIVFLIQPVDEQAGEQTVQEIPFDRVVKESEAAVRQGEPPLQLPVQPVVAQAESLTLLMRTTDTVWVSITLDGTRTEEFLFPPNWTWSWKAQNRFVLTLGNAGGATFRLNDTDIGTFGRSGVVVREAEVTAAMLTTR